MSIAAYNSKYYHAPARNNLRVGLYVYGVAGPTIGALGFGADRKGTAIPGVTCAKLHLDFSKPTFFFANGGETQLMLSPYFKYYDSYVSQEVYAQAMWLDSTTKQPKLTRPLGCLVPEMDPLDSPLRFTLWERDPKKKYGSGRTYWAGWAQPVIRYTR